MMQRKNTFNTAFNYMMSANLRKPELELVDVKQRVLSAV